MKVNFEFKDVALASYILLNGGEYNGYNLKYCKKFNEYKLYIIVNGYKDKMIELQNKYNNNKIKINKDINIINKINEIRNKVSISSKK